MDKINIGFIGGCINKQPGIQKDRNYISILKYLLCPEHTMDIETHTKSYLSYDQLAEKTCTFIVQKQLTIICVFIRPFPLFPLHKLLIKYPKANEKTGWAFHPGLFAKALTWPGKLTENQAERQFVHTPTKRCSFRDINIFMGSILMMDKWAMKYLTRIFLEIQLACKEANTQFILISPPKSPGSIMGNFVCKQTTLFFQQFCLKNNVDYLNINRLPVNCFEKDNIHVNEYGHGSIANLLHNKIHNVLIRNNSINTVGQLV